MELTVARALQRVSPMRDDQNEKQPAASKPVETKGETTEKPRRRSYETEDGDNPLICRGID